AFRRATRRGECAGARPRAPRLRSPGDQRGRSAARAARAVAGRPRWRRPCPAAQQRVYRLELTSGPAGHRSVVLKRLEPGVAERVRLVAERWLPALGLGDRCPRLLAVAADAAGATSWHAYEDLGDETLASDPTRERV